MVRQVREKHTLCLVVIGNIQSLKMQNLNNNKILSLKIYNQIKIMLDLYQEQFSNYFNKSKLYNRIMVRLCLIFTAHSCKSIIKKYSIFYKYFLT
jgi:hypothetical protein